MSDYWTETDRLGYDLAAAFEYNTAPFPSTDIEEVLAVVEGYNDGDEWNWVVRLNEEEGVPEPSTLRYAFISGWCDYTGWDCQSGVEVVMTHSPFIAAAFADHDNFVKLLTQIEEGERAKTSREDFDAEWKQRLEPSE